jgi:4-hydroxy-tetrahydrodipicolinate reductase
MGDMRLVVVGAGGRMGRALIKAVSETEGCILTGAIERAESPDLGRDAGQLAGLATLGVTVTDDALTAFAKADGVLDFTGPAATLHFAELAAQARIVHVIGTTGMTAADEARLAAAVASRRPVMPTASPGVVVSGASPAPPAWRLRAFPLLPSSPLQGAGRAS